MGKNRNPSFDDEERDDEAGSTNAVKFRSFEPEDEEEDDLEDDLDLD